MVSLTSGGLKEFYNFFFGQVLTSDVTSSKWYLIDTQQPYAQVVAEYDDVGSLTVGYVYGLERISQERGSVKRYYVADGQGSVRYLTDNNGTITDAYVYTAFGELQTRTGFSENDFMYVGEQFDPNVGFYYNRARWMDPEQGRFLSVDPWEGDPMAPISLHRYLYAGDNPVMFVDPSGEILIPLISAITIYQIVQSIVPPIYWAFTKKKRPDDDGYLTFLEVAMWWKYGKGKSLTVDISKITMSISASDFEGKKTRDFNFASFRYFSGFNTGLVYGRLGLTLVGENSVVETDGKDDYDFNIDAPLDPDLFIRNVETLGGHILHGPGMPFTIYIKGIKTIGF
jgi:RHS repeat-associated protein